MGYKREKNLYRLPVTNLKILAVFSECIFKLIKTGAIETKFRYLLG